MNKIFSLENKIALVTGASRGLGRDVCIAFSEAGADIIAVSRNEELLKSLCEEIRGRGRKALPVVADIGKAVDVMNVVEKSMNEFGRIDILVNNAGISGPRSCSRILKSPSGWMFSEQISTGPFSAPSMSARK